MFCAIIASGHKIQSYILCISVLFNLDVWILEFVDFSPVFYNRLSHLLANDNKLNILKKNVKKPFSQETGKEKDS